MLDYVIRDGLKAPLKSLPIGVMTRDIVFHSLSNINRFTGMKFATMDEPFTVLEHSIAVAEIILDVTGNAELARMGLWHDVAEAYLGDIATPVKNLLGSAYMELEACVEQQVLRYNAISDNQGLWEEVKRYDLMCCIAEIQVMADTCSASEMMTLRIIDDWFAGKVFDYDIHIIKMFAEKLRQLYHVRVFAHTGARQAMRNRAHKLDHTLLNAIANAPTITTHKFNGHDFRITRNKSDKIILIEIMG
jgi:metal dependent phosphohydrolase